MTPADTARRFPVVTRTDRDYEIPMLTEYVGRHGPFASVLDVGGHYSAQYYAATLAAATTGQYDAVDILPPDEATEAIVDRYIVANALEHTFDHLYDLVVCCSTIEHAGVSTYKRADIAAEQDRLFARCLALSRRRVWISFPIGRPYVYPDELSVITNGQLYRWLDMCGGPGAPMLSGVRFGFNERGPQAGTPWVEHDDAAFACSVQYVDAVGNQSLCILEINKGAP